MGQSKEFPRFTEYTHPTAIDHTLLPWKAATSTNGLFLILDGGGRMLASFKRREDRDLALYFANVHPGVISLLKGFAGAFSLLATNAHESVQSFAHRQAELAGVYARLFANLGKPVPPEDEHGK